LSAKKKADEKPVGALVSVVKNLYGIPHIKTIACCLCATWEPGIHLRTFLIDMSANGSGISTLHKLMVSVRFGAPL
jgi:hypothetical protein